MINISKAARYSFLWLVVIIIILPIVFTFLTSIKQLVDIITGTLVFNPTMANYKELFTGSKSNFTQLTINSFVIGILTVVMVISISTFGSYSISRLRWHKLVRGIILGWLLMVHMLPPITFIGPFYLISRRLGIYDTVLAVVMAHIVLNLPLAIWMLESFFESVPKELEEAAAVDGCSQFRTFWQVILPIVRPGIAATALLVFIFSWKDFLFALTLTSTQEGGTVPVGISTFVQEFNVRYGEMSAGSFFATIPAIILVVLAQKHIVKGMTLGALKG
jgi:multiple sugar transport system permease protein